MWQHFSVPIDELNEGSFEDGFGFDGSSIRGWQPIHASDMLVIPDPTTAVMDPFCAAPDAVADLQHRRPDHQGAVLARPAQHRAEGRGLPQVHRHRRHDLLRPRGGVLHLRRRPLRNQPASTASTTSTPIEGALEHGPGREAEPRLQAALQGRLLPGSADRSPAGPPHRDGARDGEGRASSSRRSTTRWPPPVRPRSTCGSRRSRRWPTTSCGTSTASRTWPAGTARR